VEEKGWRREDGGRGGGGEGTSGGGAQAENRKNLNVPPHVFATRQDGEAHRRPHRRAVAPWLLWPLQWWKRTPPRCCALAADSTPLCSARRRPVSSWLLWPLQGRSAHPSALLQGARPQRARSD
jgi:hypothetical protein